MQIYYYTNWKENKGKMRMKKETTTNDVTKQTKIISAFPGTGKSYAIKEIKNKYPGIELLDSDSSSFSWIAVDDDTSIIKQRVYSNNYLHIRQGHKERNPEFPNNYIQHIKENIGKVDFILVSSHQVVRDALQENNIPYTLVYPDKKLIAEYVGRYYMRGSETPFINTLIMNWDQWLLDCESEKACVKCCLKSCEYISDIIEKMIERGVK